VSVSVTSRRSTKKRFNGPSWFLAWRHPSIYDTLYFKEEIRVSPEIRVLQFGTLSQTIHLENFADRRTVLSTQRDEDGR